jgi:hypothetical protein
LCIWSASESHALTHHLLSSPILSEDAATVFSELGMNYGRILAAIIICFLQLILLKQYPLKFNVAVVEDKSLGHELLE